MRSLLFHNSLQLRCVFMELKHITVVELGRLGGRARAKALTAEQRRAIAKKASRAAAKSRTTRAKSEARLRP